MNGKEFLKQAKEIEEGFKQAIEQDITEHKQQGLDIFYIEDGISIVEKHDGTKYEYKMVDDEPIIVRKIK
ncbi:MAG: hypothetical protein WBA41_02875 [Rivularia sp. (in: cyanobacteria)]